MADVTMLREALKPFLSSVALEEMGDSVDRLNEAIEELERDDNGAVEDWKKRYESLREDYVKRFTESSGNAPKGETKPEPEKDETVDVTIDDIDFNATTE